MLKSILFVYVNPTWFYISFNRDYYDAWLNTTAWYYLVFYKHLERTFLMVNTDNSFKCKYLISIHCWLFIIHCFGDPKPTTNHQFFTSLCFPRKRRVFLKPQWVSQQSLSESHAKLRGQVGQARLLYAKSSSCSLGSWVIATRRRPAAIPHAKWKPTDSLAYFVIGHTCPLR